MRAIISSRTNRLNFFVIAVMTLLIGVSASAQAGSQLWLYPDSDDPRNGGHVVDTGQFTLNIENFGAGNGDLTAYEVFVVVAVNDPALLTGGTLELPDGTVAALDAGAFGFGTPVFPCSGHFFPGHGMFPAAFVEVFLGDLADDEVAQLAVDVQGEDGLLVHFDAFGTGYRQAGPNLRCFDISNPSGHDVSVVFGSGDDPDEPPCPDLAIDKTASASGVDLGDEVEFTITVTNDSECDATSVVVTETIPMVTGDDDIDVPAFTVIGVDPSPTQQTDDFIVWEIGDLPAGETAVFLVTVVFDEPLTDGTVVENTASVMSAEMDEPVSSTAEVAVGSAPNGQIGGPGFWCNQIRFATGGWTSAKFTVDELEGWLAAINDASPVFPELWATNTLDEAMVLLCRPDLADGTADRLARHLAALHFSLAAGRVDPGLALGDLCEGDVPMPPEADPNMTVGDLATAVETDLLAGADDDVLGMWLEIVDFVNNASTSGCSDVVQMLKAVS